jgi:hypothetical protein
MPQRRKGPRLLVAIGPNVPTTMPERRLEAVHILEAAVHNYVTSFNGAQKSRTVFEAT